MSGAPHAIDSIITSPKGSSHSIGNSVALACWRSSTFSPCVTSPTYSIRSDRCGCTSSAEVLPLERLAALPGELERQPGLDRDRDRVVRALVGRHPTEEEEVFAALGSEGVDGQVEGAAQVATHGRSGFGRRCSSETEMSAARGVIETTCS